MKRIMIAGMFALALTACNKDNVGPGGVPTGSFEEVIAAGGDFDPVSESNDLVESTSADESRDGDAWRCTTETYEANYGGGGDSGFPQFNPNASVVYPGNLLQGKTLQKATPSVISVPRAGGTISIDIVDGSQASYFEVDEVTKSAIGQAANNIIANATGAIPANLDFSYETVYSREQLAFSLGVDYHTAFSSIDAKLSFSSDREYNRTVVKLNQTYYTMSFDLPTSDADLFAEGVTPVDLAKYVAPDNPVTYISDVTYGRIYYLLVETTSSIEEMEASITASFNGVGGTGGGAEADVSKLSTLKNMKIKLFAFGGEATTTLESISNPGDLEVLGELLSESTDIRTGKPISYVVRSAYSNDIVSVALNTKYDVTNCEALNPNGKPLPYMEHWTGLLNTFGTIGAAFSIRGTTSFYLFNEVGDQFMISTPGKLEGPFPLSEFGDGTCPLDNIGAAAYLDHSDGSNTIMLFDKSGVRYTYLFLDSGRFLGIEDISGFGSDNGTGNGDCPFNLTGIEAMLSYDIEVSPSVPGYHTDLRMVFEKDSKSYSLFSRASNTFNGARHLDSFVLNHKFPFAGVSAGAGFKIDDDRYRLIFNETGDKYVIAVESWNGGYYEGPYGL